MSEITMQEALNKRNIDSLVSWMKIEGDKNIELKNEVNALRSNISQLLNEMVELRQQLAIMKAQTTGHGSTAH